MMSKENIYAYTKNGLPFGGGGIREVIRYTEGHSIYVKIDPKESPYKDQDYWQIMEGDYYFCDKDGNKQTDNQVERMNDE